jgi:dipeptidyl-peptidase 4
MPAAFPANFLRTLRAALGRAMPLALLGAALPAGAAGAADAAPGQGAGAGTALTLERLFAAPELAGAGLRGLRFSPDGTRVTWLQGSAEDKDRLDLWAYDLKTHEKARLVDARALLPQEAALSAEEEARRERARTAALRGIVEYSFSADGKRLLFPLGGDLYLYDLTVPATAAVRRLTRSEAWETDARFSPRGNFVSFSRAQDLWIIDLATGAERAVTTGGGGVISHGVAEFIAQEELGRDTGYWWAPDESSIAYATVDETPVPEVERVEILGNGTRTVKQRYPAAGQRNALVSLRVVALGGGAPRIVDLGTDTDFYLARVDWARDSRSLLVQRLSRDQTRLDLLRADPSDGRTSLVLSEQSATWVELHDLLRPLKDGGFLWASQRSGYQHLYRYSASGTLVAAVTRGNWAVTQLGALDEKAGRVWFVGSLEGHPQRQLYSAALDGQEAEQPRRLTREAGWHVVQMSRDAKFVLDTHSSVDQPARTVLRDATGKELAVLVPNRLDASHPYAPYLGSHPRYAFGTLAAEDGQTLHYQMVQPHDFDPARRYPVVVQVYGGPHGQQVMNAWDDGFAHYLARRGFLVFSLDNRGSALQGTRMDGALFHHMASVEVADQLRGVEWLKAQPYVDGERVGVFGWSYGGYMSLNLVMRAPGVFAAAVSGAPVTDWSLYDTAYTERYMGTPQANAAGYAGSSVLGVAGQLQDPLLVLHGMADDNVLFEHSTRLFKVLQEANKPFEVMVYPGHKHGLLRQASVGPHGYHTIARFLERYLQPDPGLHPAAAAP